MHLAVKNGLVEHVSALCKFGKSKYGNLVHLNQSNHIKNSPCHIAALNNNTAVMRVLVENGCDVLLENGCGHTCLSLAENIGHQDMCHYLEPVIEEAQVWGQKNCLAKLFVCRAKI